MAITKDWITEAAREIGLGAERLTPDALEQFARLAILEHCPWKPNTAYMEIPRCDTCKHWDSADKNEGQCMMMYEGKKTKIWPDYRDGINTAADFGCVQWEAKP